MGVKPKLVVVGNGMAPGRMLEHLFEDAPGMYDVTIFNAEPRVNYNRLMLSPVLSGEKTYAEIITHDDDWYARHGVKLHKSARVSGIDRGAKTVTAENGIKANYDKLVVATGSNPFIIPVPGHELNGVLTYRDLDDVEAMLNVATGGGRAVVIGGGLLGLEAAAGLRRQGMAVTVLHLMPILMERQLDAEAATMLRSAFEELGVDVITEANTKTILGHDGKVVGVELADGTRIDAKIVVMAVGIRPSSGLANEVGLETNRGIVVDDALITSDPDIFALGECAEHRGICYGLVAPLYDMAKVIADQLAGNTKAAYEGSVTATKLKVTGINLYSAGDFAHAEDREEIVLRDASVGVYKRIVIKDDVILGAVLYGDTEDGPALFDMVQSGENVSRIRDTLIFGAAYHEADPLDPMVAVAALPGEFPHRCGGPISGFQIQSCLGAVAPTHTLSVH